ncbi:ion channel [Nitrospirillum pindoramense]|uniref:Inward rectifier potassium channel n=1 Tax=Nitrospirillum amazonense TaxID=28077 RepID=A0A560HC02_9PROT|nr:ion channel [Nitrospirillum amazonense]TWB43249.1 inward rectifier potassium channel [Nitrospirillum amazonense]
MPPHKRLARLHQRRITVDGRPFATLKGVPALRWQDPYHFLLSISWGGFFGLALAVYLVANLVFAGLYLADPGGVTNARVGSFADAFFFSVQTLGTMGYGVMAPKTVYANSVAAAESFTGMLGVAQITGLIFARFSRPRAMILFSRNILFTQHDGYPVLMLRAGNTRGNQILEARASVSVSTMRITEEGALMRGFEELTLMRAKSPLFALSWTIVHRIDETSPLYGQTEWTLRQGQANFIVLLSGTDDSYSQTVYGRKIYDMDDALWGRRFVDIINTRDDGYRLLDFDRFHETEPQRLPAKTPADATLADKPGSGPDGAAPTA